MPDGDPAGVKVVEKSNWSGTELVVPRPLFGATKSRHDCDRAGAYILVGQSEDSPLPKVYVGEGDPVRPRIEQHGRAKDFWTHAVVFTSKDQNLNKAHVQRLESRVIELARDAKRCVLDNGNTPQPPSLSEAVTAEVEGFLDDMMLCLPTLGYDYFEPAVSDAVAPTLALLFGRRGSEARGFDTPQGFLVKRGSFAVKTETNTCPLFVRNLRLELLKQGVLRDVGDRYELTQDYTFSSPSAAGAVLAAANINGRTEWQTADGRTLKAIQESQGGA